MTRRQPAHYDWARLLFDETIMGKHYYSGRTAKIAFVVAHHMTIVGTGNGRANDACFNTWKTRKASAHYGVDGAYVRQFVWDKDTAWATGSGIGNSAGLSIEHANSAAGGSWPVSETTWKNGARLAAYLHRAHGLGRPTSTNGGRGGTLRKHSSFFATACPGPFFDSIWSRYVAEAQRVYDAIGSGSSPTPTPDPPKDWLSMATKEEVRALIREENARLQVTRSPNAPATVYRGKKSVLPTSALARIWSVAEATLKGVRARVRRPSHLPDDIYKGQKDFSLAQAHNRSWTVTEATLKEVRESRALLEELAKRDGLPVASLLATVQPFLSAEVPDEDVDAHEDETEADA